jgi:hypothetical protein
VIDIGSAPDACDGGIGFSISIIQEHSVRIDMTHDRVAGKIQDGLGLTEIVATLRTRSHDEPLSRFRNHIPEIVSAEEKKTENRSPETFNRRRDARKLIPTSLLNN